MILQYSSKAILQTLKAYSHDTHMILTHLLVTQAVHNVNSKLSLKLGSIALHLSYDENICKGKLFQLKVCFINPFAVIGF